MKKKFFTLALLSIATISSAGPVSTPNNLSDTPIVSGSDGNTSCETTNLTNITNRTIDLTNATSDYKLQLGETAIIKFSNIDSVPLHIEVPEPCSPAQPIVYEITVVAKQHSGIIIFYPNNTQYLHQFQYTTYGHTKAHWGGVYYTWGSPGDDSSYHNGFTFILDAGDPPYIGTFKTIYYGTKYPKYMTGDTFESRSMSLNATIWNNTTTKWRSLGTVNGLKGSIGQIIVKRIL